jgi:hypothetical protein
MLSTNSNSINNYDIYGLVRQIHKYNKDNNKRFVIAPTGGGILCLSLLFSQAGASSSILECTIPYACESTLEYTNFDEIKSWASTDTSNKLAYAAFLRCDKLIKASNLSNDPVGIGATGNLVSNGTWKRGTQGIFVSVKSKYNMTNFSLDLYKGIDPNPFRTRQEEDDLCGKLIVCVCAYECRLLDAISLLEFMNNNGLDKLDSLTITNDPIHDLLNEKINQLICTPKDKGLFDFSSDFEPYVKKSNKLVILPGSFNPVHQAHTYALTHSIGLVENSIGMYELSITNATKPKLSYGEIISRLNNFRNQQFPILLTTKAPLFIKKAEDYPNATFVMGIDTLLRLFDPQFGEVKKITNDFIKVTSNGSRFIIFPRIISSANISPEKLPVNVSVNDPLFLSMVKDKIPPELVEFFIEVTDNIFMNLSSSQLRKV